MYKLKFTPVYTAIPYLTMPPTLPNYTLAQRLAARCPASSVQFFLVGRCLGIRRGNHCLRKVLACRVMWSYGGFLKWGYPQIIHFSRVSHSKPSSYWGTPNLGNLHMYPLFCVNVICSAVWWWSGNCAPPGGSTDDFPALDAPWCWNNWNIYLHLPKKWPSHVGK